jgi:hypothetical protein
MRGPNTPKIFVKQRQKKFHKESPPMEIKPTYVVNDSVETPSLTSPNRGSIKSQSHSPKSSPRERCHEEAAPSSLFIRIQSLYH